MSTTADANIAADAGRAQHGSLGDAFAEFRAAAASQVDEALNVVACEARVAAATASAIFALAALAAALIGSAWVFAGLALLRVAADLGVEPPAFLALLSLASIALGWLTWRRVLQLTRHLGFPASRSLLRGRADP